MCNVCLFVAFCTRAGRNRTALQTSWQLAHETSDTRLVNIYTSRHTVLTLSTVVGVSTVQPYSTMKRAGARDRFDAIFVSL